MIDPLPGDTFRIGQILNNTYEILGILGRGGTGEVYKARNTINNRIVAIKVLNAEFSASDDYLELIKREEEMRAIVHDAVVRYSDNSRTDDGHIFLVMDFVDGPSMNDYLKRGGMDTRDLLIVAHRVAEGLVATHARGIVHRDLSPDNIILRGNNPAQATIIDFGIAKDTTDGARTIVGNEFAGKYEYAAPEQIDGHAEARSDLYALGASLLATFRGQVPRVGSSPGQVVRIKQQPLDTSGVPEPLKKVVDWLTSPQISDRPRDAAELVHYLDDIVMPGKSKPEAKPERQRPKKKRRVWPWLILLLGGALGGAWYAGVLQPIVMPYWNRYFPPELPFASPYQMVASLDENGEAMLRTNAPDKEQGQTIAAAFATVTGASVPEGAIELAQGVPSEEWSNDIASFFNVASGLEDWTLVVSNTNVGLSGLATDRDEKAFIEARLAEVAAQAGFSADTDIAAGPRLLAAGALADAVSPLADCGHLTLDPPGGENFILGDTVRFSGDVASTDTIAAIRDRLARIVGDRDVRLDLSVLNTELCTISSLLPDASRGDITIALGFGDRSDPNLTGVYAIGDNPTIDVVMPAARTEGYIWVSVVDVTGNVYNLLPNINRRDNTLRNIGEVEEGLRRIRVAYSEAERAEDTRRLAFEIEETFGKSQVIVVHSNEPLFTQLRPTTESVDSFAEALRERLSDDRLEIYAISTRLLDSRN
jgi:eukaryotic-like serine/threonine-protein kinase